MESTAYLIKRVQDESNKGRTLVFDLYVDGLKTEVKEEFTPDELESWLDNQPEGTEIRIRMYYVYGANNTRHIEEFLLKPERSTSYPEPLQPPEPTPTHAVPSLGSVSPSSDNPLTWILQERTERLNEIKGKYERAKEKNEEYRDQIVKLERDLLQKDHTISNLTSQNEQGKGLNGFLSSNPGIAERLIDVAGPRLMDILAQSAPNPQIGQSQITKDIVEWIDQLNPEEQVIFREIVVAIATKHQTNPEYLHRLNQLLNKNQDQDESPLSKVS